MFGGTITYWEGIMHPLTSVFEGYYVLINILCSDCNNSSVVILLSLEFEMSQIINKYFVFLD